MPMAKRKSGSSAQGKQIVKKGHAILPADFDDEGIDYSDIPEQTDEQLKAFKRVGRPPFGEFSKQMIAIRIEPRLIDALKALAQKEGIGYQTLINVILESYLAKNKPASPL
jgi:predicted DNA binding CopG/RHH family protein